MKRVFLVVFIILASFLLITCEGNSDSKYESEPSAPDGSPSGSDGSSFDSGEENNVGQNRPTPGQLTCGEWSDIKNYDFYLNLFTADDAPDIEESQRRKNYSKLIGYFGFETRYMFTVYVVYNGHPVSDAVVELYDSDGNKLFVSVTSANGKAFLFPNYNLEGENITVKITSGIYESESSFVYTQNNKEITLTNRAEPKSVLDIMFVIDTTGSMGDELNYLKSEIADVINTISSDNPNYTINLALLFYRDIGDEYVTRYFDFTTNISQQQQNLKRQSANGGGDFPEAADRALSEAVEKKWNAGYATRLIFHVCDAPPHDKQENQTLFFNSVKMAAQKGIRIIPIASSGIDLNTEYLLRQEALMTGGTYIFLTDDSGIGNEHLKPTVGEFTVEYLNACMVRTVNEYLTGVETEPVPY